MKIAICFSAENQIKFFEILKERAFLLVALQSCGDIAFATNKFELYQDFMHRVQARSPLFFLQIGSGA